MVNVTKCIACNRFDETCDHGLRTAMIFGVGVVSVSRLDYGEIECRHFVPHVDFGPEFANNHLDAVRHRREIKQRHNLGFKKNVKRCLVCGYAVCRCKSRRAKSDKSHNIT